MSYNNNCFMWCLLGMCPARCKRILPRPMNSQHAGRCWNRHCGTLPFNLTKSNLSGGAYVAP